MEAIVHTYAHNLIAVEHVDKETRQPFGKVILMLNGLTGGVTDLEYVGDVAKAIAPLGWGIIVMQTRSSYQGWGTGTLTRDAADMTSAIKYLRSIGKSKVVIAGISTGCQDNMYYLTQQYDGDDNDLASRPKVDGCILQASASDREAYISLFGKDMWKQRLDFAKDWVRQGKELDILPREFSKEFFGAPITALRWVSLQDVRGGDDYFSSDLTKDDFAKTFGKVRVPILVAYSEKDMFVPSYVDKQKLVNSFKAATDPELWCSASGLIQEADHAIYGPNCGDLKVALDDFISKVTTFLKSIDEST